jgi:hypothetical protein
VSIEVVADVMPLLMLMIIVRVECTLRVYENELEESVSCIGDMRDSFSVLGRKQLGILVGSWKDNIIVVLTRGSQKIRFPILLSPNNLT